MSFVRYVLRYNEHIPFEISHHIYMYLKTMIWNKKNYRFFIRFRIKFFICTHVRPSRHSTLLWISVISFLPGRLPIAKHLLKWRMQASFSSLDHARLFDISESNKNINNSESIINSFEKPIHTKRIKQVDHVD